MTHSLRGRSGAWLHAFLLGADRPGSPSGAAGATMGCPANRLPPAGCAGAACLSGSRLCASLSMTASALRRAAAGATRGAGGQLLRYRRRRRWRCSWSAWGATCEALRPCDGVVRRTKTGWVCAHREHGDALHNQAERSAAGISRRRDCGSSPLRGRRGRCRNSSAKC